VKSACNEGELNAGLTKLQRRGLTCLIGVGGLKCLKEAATVAMSFPLEKQRLAKLFQRLCKRCGRGVNRSMTPCWECEKKARTELKRTKSHKKTWQRYRDDLLDEGVSYPASQQDFEKLESNYRHLKVAFHVYDRRGKVTTIFQIKSFFAMKKMVDTNINLTTFYSGDFTFKTHRTKLDPGVKVSQNVHLLRIAVVTEKDEILWHYIAITDLSAFVSKIYFAGKNSASKQIACDHCAKR
jgi:hypothetical protein